MVKVNIKALITLFSFIYMAASGQVWPGPHPLLSPWIKINAEDRIASQVDTFENKFGYYRGEGTINIPVYRGKDWLTATGNTPLIGVTLQAAASLMQPQGDFLPDTLQLLRARGGVNFIYSKGLRNLFTLNVQGVAAHEVESFSLGGAYINGSAFWRHRFNDQFSTTLGLAYTSVFARNRLLPLAGITWRPLKEDLFIILFPAYLQYTHFFGRSTALSVSARPFGGIYTMDFPVNDSIRLEDVTFRHREFQVALKLRVKISYQLSVEPEGGFSGPVHLEIADQEYKTSSSAFIRMMIRYKFGQRANVAPILDFDPADFINADPEIPEN
jgi:hypothetical protein